MLRVAITGSIGMGKSETARTLSAHGFPLYDADAAVHALYAPGGAGVGPVGAMFPEAVRDGAVDRAALAGLALGDAEKMRALEAVVHPLLSASRQDFLAAARAARAPAVLFDIPLLFETGGDKAVDLVVVASAPYAVQRQRVLARPDMDEEKFQKILARQLPDEEKRRRSDVVIDTGRGRAYAAGQIKALAQRLKRGGG